MSERKRQLLEDLIAYLTRHGLTDLSLRPMAKEVKTSARLLIFHFHSKDMLLAEVLDEMQSRLQLSLNELLAVKTGGRRAAPLRMFWDWAIEDKNLPYLRVLYQLNMLAMQNRKAYAKYFKRNALNWIELIQAALQPSQRSATLATLIGAVFDGLFIDLMSTGDRRRTTLAIDQFIEMAGKHGRTAGRSTP